LDVGINKYDLMRSICQDSLVDFVKEFWEVLVPDEELIWNWHIKYLCDELQQVAERVIAKKPKEYDLVINISPGSTKSTLASIMLPAWMWSRMPSARIIGGSYSSELSMDLSRKNRDMVRSEKYQKMFPNIELRMDQDVKSYFANTSGGSRYATSTGGAVTGFHAHLIVIDDPLDPGLAVSEIELKKANTWITETINQRKVDKTITPIILIMQRLHQNDPTADILRRAKEAQRNAVLQGNEDAPMRVKHICLPAEVSERVHPPELKKKYVGGLMDPVRLSEEVLNDIRPKEYLYAGQFMQWPVPVGGGMFKIERLAIDVPPARHWQQIVRFWDKAATEGGGAYSVGVKMGKDEQGYYWVLHVCRGRWSSEVREERILQCAQIDGKDVIVGLEQEPGASGKTDVRTTIKMLAGYRIKAVCPSGDKTQRADPFSVQVNSRNVRMAAGEWNTAYLEELEFFPASTYKDQVDASSGAFDLLSTPVIRAGGPKRQYART